MIKKNSLGKGLGAMFPDLLEKIGDKPVLLTCGIEELVPNRFQPRRDFNDESQKALVASVLPDERALRAEMRYLKSVSY